MTNPNPLIRLGHNLLENRYAYSTYQFCVGGYSYRKRVVTQHIRHSNPNVVLDLGCGPGPTLNYLPENIDFVGVDISQDYLRLARRKSEKTTLVQADVTSTTWLSAVSMQKPELVLVMGLFHHLDDGQVKKLLNNIAAATSAGAVIVSVDPTITKTSTALAAWFAMNDRGRFVRTPSELTNLIMRSSEGRFVIETRVQSNNFHVPLDTIECVLVKS